MVKGKETGPEKAVVSLSLDEKIKETIDRKQQLQDNLTKLSKMIEETRAQLIFIEGKLEAYTETNTRKENSGRVSK